MRGESAEGDDPDGNQDGIAERVEVVGDVFEVGAAIARLRLRGVPAGVGDDDDADIEAAFGFGQQETDVVAVEELAVAEFDFDGDAFLVEVEVLAVGGALADQPFGPPAVAEEGVLGQLVGAVAVGKTSAGEVQVEVSEGALDLFFEPVVGGEDGLSVAMFKGTEVHGSNRPS